MPRFSIVIPMTRPHYMAGVLGSVLAQTFADFEVVVSDNSGGKWPEGASLADPRVRVVKPQGYLTVGKHWDFALAHAKGDWQLMVCDDDALVPQALQAIDRVLREHPGVEAVRWRHAAYTHDGKRSGVVAIPRCTGQAYRLRSAEVLADIFAAGTIPGPVKDRSPNMPMAACSRELLARIREASGGRIFPSVEPMTSMSMLALACTDEVLILEQALTVLGASDDSAAGSIRSVEGAGNTVFERTNAESWFQRLPIPSRRILPAWKSEVILELQQTNPAKFGRYQFNWAAYFWHSYESIEEIRRDGWDVSAELRMFAEAMAAQPDAVRSEVAARIRWHRFLAALGDLRRVAGRLKRGVFGAGSATVDGPRFRSIDAAAAHVGKVTSA